MLYVEHVQESHIQSLHLDGLRGIVVGAPHLLVLDLFWRHDEVFFDALRSVFTARTLHDHHVCIQLGIALQYQVTHVRYLVLEGLDDFGVSEVGRL